MLPKVHLISLGCPKNLVDSEYLLGYLSELDFEVTDDPDQADILIVNTCAFIQPAVEESVETVLSLAEIKRKGAAEKLVVTGCLPQRYGRQLPSLLPEVDLFWGASDINDLADRIRRLWAGGSEVVFKTGRPGFAPAAPGPRLRSAPFYRAYLKIAEGCSNTCTYCLIPKLRGPLVSRPLPVLLEEASALAGSGVKELILVAQDTTAYGRDLAPGTTLARLLEELAQIEGLAWIRVMYAYPSGLNDRLIGIMADQPKICPYLDLPWQHASPGILKRMGRRRLKDDLGLIGKLRREIPDLTLRTTLMVGFPGETESDFEHLLDFVRQACFERLGVFKFSPEEGALASTWPDQVQQRIKENRRRKVMAVQRRISRAANQALVGRVFPVLVEGLSAETDLLLEGRTPGQAPEIDGRVYINRGRASAGDIKPVLITEAHDYDLVGEIINDD